MVFDENSAEQLNLPTSGGHVRVMLITKSKSYGAILSFLQRRNYDLVIVPTAFLAVKESQTFKPHVVLLSWNTQNVGKMYELFAKTMRTICIVFSETTNRKTAAALTSSGIPNTMTAPITGPGTHMRIQALLRKKSARLNDKKKKKKNISTPSKIEIPVDSIDKVPSDTFWEKSSDTSKNSSSEIMWLGTHKDASGKNNTFHFFGPKPPKYNEATKSWDDLDLKNLTQVNIDPADFFETVSNGDSENDYKIDKNNEPSSDNIEFDDSFTKELSINQDSDSEIEDDDPLFNAEDPYQHDPQNLASQATKLHKNHDSKKLSILAHHTRGVLESLVEPDKQEPAPIGIVESVAVATVESAHFRGYLVCNSSKGFSVVDLMDKMFEKLKDKMSISNEPMRKVTKTLILQCKPIDFIEWAKENSEFIVSSQQGLSSFAIAYVPVEAIPEILETTKEDIVKVNLETDIYGETKILFDIYIFMEKNNKYIKYLRKNTVISQDTIDKLLNFGIMYVYVRKAETQLLYSYWANIRIFQAS